MKKAMQPGRKPLHFSNRKIRTSIAVGDKINDVWLDDHTH
jgi:hypothetical protein